MSLSSEDMSEVVIWSRDLEGLDKDVGIVYELGVQMRRYRRCRSENERESWLPLQRGGGVQINWHGALSNLI